MIHPAQILIAAAFMMLVSWAHGDLRVTNLEGFGSGARFSDPWSVDYNGTDEWSRSNNNAFTIADSWTGFAWIKPTAVAGTMIVTHLGKLPTPTDNDISLRVVNCAASPCDLRVTVYTIDVAPGTICKQWDTNNTPITAGAWNSVAATWGSDGGSNLQIYVNGVEITGANLTKTTDIACGVMLDQTRTATVGASSTGTNRFTGRIHSDAWWDVVLSGATVASLHNRQGRIDLRSDSGNYTSSANLQHWWQLCNNGEADANIGDDTGVAATQHDVDDADFNITFAGDCMRDAP